MPPEDSVLVVSVVLTVAVCFFLYSAKVNVVDAIEAAAGPDGKSILVLVAVVVFVVAGPSPDPDPGKICGLLP